MRALCLFLSLVVYVSAYEYGQHVEEGTRCRKRTGEMGSCTHFSYCRSAIREVRNNGRPEICSFAGIYPIVCCNDDNSQVYEGTTIRPENMTNYYPYYIPFNESSISLKKCREYYSTSTQGSAIEDEYPYLALIGFDDEENVEWKCTGTLISEQFVLLAAHCTTLRMGAAKYVRLGKIGQRDNYSNLSDVQQFTIKKAYVHPKYKMPSKYHDIALVELDRPVKFNYYIKPACLNVTRNVNITDFRTPYLKQYESRDPSSSILQTDYFTYTPNKDCQKAYNPQRTLKHGIVDETQICVSNLDRNKCYDAPGTSLVVNNFFYEFNNFPEIVGVPSFGKSCTSSPDIFTRVSYYVSWIENIVWSH